MSKRYFWLKLPEGFFERAEVKILEQQPNGAKYLVFLLKLLLKSLANCGYLRINAKIPYTAETLAAVTGTDIDIVRAAMIAFRELGLVEEEEDHTLVLALVDDMVGSEGDSAPRMRRLREQKAIPELTNTIKEQIVDGKASLCDGDVTKMCIELDKELEKRRVKADTKETPPNLSRSAPLTNQQSKGPFDCLKDNREVWQLLVSHSLKEEANALLKAGREKLRGCQWTTRDYFVAIAAKKAYQGNDTSSLKDIWVAAMGAINGDEDISWWIQPREIPAAAQADIDRLVGKIGRSAR